MLATKISTQDDCIYARPHSIDNSILTWSHAYQIGTLDQVIVVESVQDLSAILKSHRGGPIKALGKNLSYQGIASLDGNGAGLLLDLSVFTGLSNDHGDLVFGANTSLQEVADALTLRSLQLKSCPGVLTVQTVAGALATGTHGQGLNIGGLSDTIDEMHVVLASGDIMVLSRLRNAEIFHAFTTHLGCLGIITHVKFRTEKLKIYKCVKFVTDFNYMLEQFASLNAHNRHAKAWWFPSSDQVNVWVSNEADQVDSLKYFNGGCQLLKMTESDNAEVSFMSTLDALMRQMEVDTRANANRSADQFRTLTRFQSLDTCVGNQYQIWCKGIPVPQINCEIAIDMDRLPEVLNALREWYQKQPPSKQLHYPFILRACGKSDSWLAPSDDKDVCWIGFLVYLTGDYKAKVGGLDLMREIEELLSLFGGRPHFGKFFTPELYDLCSLLPKFEKFKQLRRDLDPADLFMNKYLGNLGL